MLHQLYLKLKLYSLTLALHYNLITDFTSLYSILILRAQVHFTFLQLVSYHFNNSTYSTNSHRLWEY